MEIKEHLVVDALVVVHIQLPATEKVDVSHDGKRCGRRSGRTGILVRKEEKSTQGGSYKQENEDGN